MKKVVYLINGNETVSFNEVTRARENGAEIITTLVDIGEHNFAPMTEKRAEILKANGAIR